MIFAPLLALLVAATPSPPASVASPSPSPSPEHSGPIILFLIDNSASLPPLDPDEKRVAALERMFTFLQGQPYRLILFGGRQELFVDDVSKYNNRGQWTDFYFAFVKAKEIIDAYPPKTPFRIVLLTDGLLDPGPADWAQLSVPPDQELKAYVHKRTVDLLREMQVPLYVILVGDVPAEGIDPKSREQAPVLILDMVRAANGAAASQTAQSLASFFKDDGVLLKKFVFRVAPHEGLKKVEPVIRRIIAPTRPVAEVEFLGLLVLPLTLLLFLMLGILVRSFPGPGDVEVLEMSLGVPYHLAADRLHKVESGGWGTTGLSIATDARDAHATVTYQTPQVDLAGTGLDTSGLDALTLRLLPLGLEELRRALESASEAGSKEEKIYALNLDYMGKNFDPREAERLLAAPPAERRRVPPLDYLRSKVHLLTNDSLRRKLTEPRVHFARYGKTAERKDVQPGSAVQIGRYGFVLKDVARGGRKDARLVLYYERIPSLLGLKTMLPASFQRAFRLRRSSQRLVT